MTLHCRTLILLGFLITPILTNAQEELGRYWLVNQSTPLEAWEWDVDHDGDGLSTRSEYFSGTDPFDPQSVISPRLKSLSDSEYLLDWQAPAQTRFRIDQSDDLMAWNVLEELVLGIGDPLSLMIESDATQDFYTIVPLPSPDSDLDGLSDREENLLGTNPDVADTDDDTILDGEEIFQTKTDPLVFDPAGGSISGRVFLDDDTDGDLTGAEPVEGATVYLDLNYNAKLDEDEPRQDTAADGGYVFSRLSPGLYEVRQVLIPGEIQTLPAEVTPEIPNRLADEVVNYTHAEGALAEP